MLPDDFRDGLFATLGLILLISFGVFFKLGAVNLFTDDITSGDNIELTLLNLLRAETINGDVANLIALNENNRDYLATVQGAVIQNLNFVFHETEYYLKITYPNGDKLFFSPFFDLGATELSPGAENKFNDGKSITEEVLIPSLNNGTIKIELVVHDE